MTFSFRAMTSEETAQRDIELEAQKKRLSGKDSDVYWRARASGFGLDYDFAKMLWDRGYVVAAMDEISDEAVQRVRDMIP